MGQRFAQPWIRTSVNVSPELHELCKKYRIKFSDAMRTGISILLAEKGVKEYDNKLNVVRRCQELKIQVAENLQKIADIQNENNNTLPNSNN